MNRKSILHGSVLVGLVLAALFGVLRAQNADAISQNLSQLKSQPLAGQTVYLPITNNKSAFYEGFDGDPAAPTPWQSPNWDITVHSRNTSDNLYALTPMDAWHGLDCSPPPATHQVATYEGAVYQCRDHLMTAINDENYGAIYLTPNQMVDFGNGEAVIRFDLSTLRTSGRDWITIWITPFDDNLQLPLEDWLPDLSGEPRNAVKFSMSLFPDETTFQAQVVRNFNVQDVEDNPAMSYEDFLEPSAVRRDTFEIRISRDHLMFGMPDYNYWWIDADIQPLGWTQGVVQFSHHSYNPTKGCNTCGPNTWHWDNIRIVPSVPFTMIQADRRYVDASTPPFVNFSQPAPENAYLRFAGIGSQIEVSFDGGATWQPAQVQDQRKYNSGAFWSYWTPIPAGVSTVYFRGGEWWGGDWHVRSISIWARK